MLPEGVEESLMTLRVPLLCMRSEPVIFWGFTTVPVTLMVALPVLRRQVPPLVAIV